MQTVSKAIKKLMTISPYYGLFATGLNRQFVKDLPTAGVTIEGINYKLLIGEDFWKDLNDDQRIGVIWHELLHIVFFHLPDYKDYLAKFPDKRLLNISSDLEVQSYIPEEYWLNTGIGVAEELFKQIPYLPKRMGTKFYWEFLNNLTSGGNGCSDSDKQESMDEAIDGYNSLSEEQQQHIQTMITSSEDIHKMWEEIMDQIDNNMKDLIKSQTEYQMKETAKGTKSIGSWPSELCEKLNELLTPKPPVFNWKAYFRRILGSAFDVNVKKTRRKESKRFSENPGLKLKKKHKILVGIDTSGSVNAKDFVDFFSELKHIYKAGADIHILECDCAITKEYDYKGKTPEQVYGRGGTSFEPVINWYNEHRKEYTTCVYFTDGFGDQDYCKPLGQVLWIITSDGNTQGKYPGIKICIPNN